jgi:hypothetical protein
MKSIKTNPNYAKAPDKGENCKKNCIAYYWQQKEGFSKLCVKIEKDVIPTYSIFQHVSII